MNDIRLARAVLARYADGGGLTDSDLARLKSEFQLSDRQVEALKSALRDGYIERSERDQLSGRIVQHGASPPGVALFSNRFLQRLAGRDGLTPLRARMTALVRAAENPSTPELTRIQTLEALAGIYQSTGIDDEPRVPGSLILFGSC